MSLAFHNEIDVAVSVARGAIAAVEIRPRTRPPLTRLFAGKPVSSLPGVLPRLFSLCSTAHQAAFLSAVEAAHDRGAGPDTKRRRITAVLAERLAELLRGIFAGRLALDGGSAAAIRSVMQASAVLGHGAPESGQGQSRREAASRIKAALMALGLSNEEAVPAPGSALATRLAALEDCAFAPVPPEPSFLSAADDRGVLMRLLADGAVFSDSPDLHGRVPETGVWARQAMRESALTVSESGPTGRLKARIAEAGNLSAWLEAREADGADDAFEEGTVESYHLGAGRGAAAVECARGRLYHLIELDDDDRLVRFEFLAPTEWNFHARGPLVRSLHGSVPPNGAEGEGAVRALVESFDPCVGFSLTFCEVGDA